MKNCCKCVHGLAVIAWSRDWCTWTHLGIYVCAGHGYDAGGKTGLTPPQIGEFGSTG
jgi:hypothetical protein